MTLGQSTERLLSGGASAMRTNGRPPSSVSTGEIERLDASEHVPSYIEIGGSAFANWRLTSWPFSPPISRPTFSSSCF
jgi:hypothetical protein